jgi:hypothetical protein
MSLHYQHKKNLSLFKPVLQKNIYKKNKGVYKFAQNNNRFLKRIISKSCQEPSQLLRIITKNEE